MFRDKVISDFVDENRRESASGVVDKVAKCRWCGSLFVKNHSSEVYCCSFCRDTAREEQSRDKAIRWYHRNKHNLSEEQKYGLGSGFLGCHRRLDFDDELRVVENELVRLKVRR